MKVTTGQESVRFSYTDGWMMIDQIGRQTDRNERITVASGQNMKPRHNNQF